MKKLTALAVAAVAAPLAIGISAPPASAAGVCDGVYPPGQAYGLRRSPGYALVNAGTTIALSTRLVRGNVECTGERVGFYTRGRGGTTFRLSRPVTLGGRGLSVQNYLVRDDFRWFTDHVKGANRVAQSPGGLVQIRR